MIFFSTLHCMFYMNVWNYYRHHRFNFLENSNTSRELEIKTNENKEKLPKRIFHLRDQSIAPANVKKKCYILLNICYQTGFCFLNKKKTMQNDLSIAWWRFFFSFKNSILRREEKTRGKWQTFFFHHQVQKMVYFKCAIAFYSNF